MPLPVTCWQTSWVEPAPIAASWSKRALTVKGAGIRRGRTASAMYSGNGSALYRDATRQDMFLVGMDEPVPRTPPRVQLELSRLNRRAEGRDVSLLRGDECCAFAFGIGGTRRTIWR